VKFAVLGSSGAIGSHALSLLRTQVHAVVDVPGRGVLDLARDPRAVRDWVRANAPDVVIHLAGARPLAAPAELFATSCGGTYALLEALRAEGSRARVVVASSAAVYGPQPEDRPIAESAPRGPLGAYGFAKAAEEDVALAFRRDGIDVRVARLFNVAGASGDRRSVLAALTARIVRAAANDVLELRDAAFVRDFVHVDDAVAGMLALARSPAGVTVMNVCTGTGVRISELAERIALRARKRIRFVSSGAAHAGAIPWSVGDPSLLRTTGWSPVRALEDAVDDALERARGED
jgi:nucleoside-diphosphate-sugar epimerase